MRQRALQLPTFADVWEAASQLKLTKSVGFTIKVSRLYDYMNLRTPGWSEAAKPLHAATGFTITHVSPKPGCLEAVKT